MWPTRQIEIYANGRVLHYDRQHVGPIFYTTSEKLTPIQSHTARSKGRGTTLTVTLKGGAVEQLC